MELEKALSQISEIHEHLAKTHVYRDFKAVPIALSGVAALAAAFLQPYLAPLSESGAGSIFYWLVVAVLGALVSGGGIVREYVFRSSEPSRRHTRTVLGQFFPCLAAGILVTVVALMRTPDLIPYLPGFWAMLYGLGVFSARPYLPRMIGFAALFYLLVGNLLLVLIPHDMNLFRWGMGLTFGLGQIFSGLILYWNLERRNHEY